MASSSGKRKSTRPRPLTDEDLQNFLDMLDNDDDADGALMDSDIEDGDSDDGDEDTETNFVNIVDNPIRHAKLPNLEETMNEDNYDRLPPQRKQTFLWKAKDKWKHKNYKWDTIYNTEGRLAREQIIPNRPGPSRKARNAKSIE